MKTIDFLPEHYRQRALLRRARAWWGICAAIFGTVIVVSSGSQVLMYRSMQRQFAELEPQCLAAEELDSKFATLRQQVAQREETAALYAYLRHPWPRSQVIAAVVSRVPDCVELTGIGVQAEEAHPDSEAVAPRKRNVVKKETAAEAQSPPRLRDLAKLREVHDSVTTVVDIRGTTSDDAQLHQYVQFLSDHPLFASAQLVSINATESPSTERRSVFVVRVQVCPGYGQPGGPSVAQPTTEKAQPSENPQVRSPAPQSEPSEVKS